jgi:maltooligosyltrehalose trehalohydrolase
VLRFFSEDAGDRLLLVNFSVDLNLPSIADPLVAPPAECNWTIEWSSENPVYGGSGTPPVEHKAGWHIPGHAAIVLASVPRQQAPELADPPHNPALNRVSVSLREHGRDR